MATSVGLPIFKVEFVFSCSAPRKFIFNDAFNRQEGFVILRFIYSFQSINAYYL